MTRSKYPFLMAVSIILFTFSILFLVNDDNIYAFFLVMSLILGAISLLIYINERNFLNFLSRWDHRVSKSERKHTYMTLSLSIFSAVLGIFAVIFYYSVESLYNLFLSTSLIFSILTIISYTYKSRKESAIEFSLVLFLITNYALFSQRLRGYVFNSTRISSVFTGIFSFIWRLILSIFNGIIDIVVFIYDAIVWLILLIPRTIIMVGESTTLEQILITLAFLVILAFGIIIAIRNSK